MKLNLATLTGIDPLFNLGSAACSKASVIYSGPLMFALQGTDLQKRVWHRRMAYWHASSVYIYSVISSANAERKTVIVETVEESCNLL